MQNDDTQQERTGGGSGTPRVMPPKRWHFEVHWWSDPMEPERHILPTLTFVSSKHPIYHTYAGEGWSLTLEWWCYAVGLFAKRKAA
jgi:hypothetical protein